jgi:hypothetical protein
LEKTNPIAVVPKNFYEVTSPATKKENLARQRTLIQRALHQAAQAGVAAAHIRDSSNQPDLRVGRNHPRKLSTTARTISASTAPSRLTSVRPLIGHRDRQQSHLLFNAALVSQLPSPEKLPPVKDLIRIYAMLPSYRRYRQTRRQCLLYDPPLFLGGPIPPPTRSALTKLHTCIHPSPSAATCYRRSSLIA